MANGHQDGGSRQTFPDEGQRHLINLALRGMITVVAGFAVFQFREISGDLKELRQELEKGKQRLVAAESSNFSAKEWAVQKEIIDRRNVDQSTKILENLAATKSLRDDVTRLQEQVQHIQQAPK